MIYQVKNLEMSLKDIDTSKREVVVQFSRYGVLDSDGDIAKKGMFNKSVSDNFRRIRHLMNHDITQVVGVPQQIWDDGEGAYMRSKIGTHSLGEEYIKMAESGIIDEHSYGFAKVRQEKTAAGNVLHEVKLWEVSSVTWGANEHTRLVSLEKGFGVDKISERVKRLEKFVKNTDATDDTIELLLLEIKQLSALIEQFKSTEPDDATQPDDSLEDSVLTELKLLSIKI